MELITPEDGLASNPIELYLECLTIVIDPKFRLKALCYIQVPYMYQWICFCGTFYRF